MEYVEPNQVAAEVSTRVWSVGDFCEKYRIDDKEKTRLLQLFGNFATASELLNNSRREPRYR